MNANRRLRFLGTILVLGLALTLLARPVHAATVTWDSSVSGGPHDGSGSWTLSGSNWWNSAVDQLWNNANNDTAQFGTGSGSSTAYSVTVGQATSAGGIIFQNQAYTLTGGTLTLGGATPTITVNASGGTIGSVLAGTAGLTKAGTGTLTLFGANTYSSGTTLTLGYLALTAPGGATPIPGNIAITNAASNANVVYTTQNNQFGPGAVMSFNGTAGNGYFELDGTTQTLAGVNETNSRGVIENQQFAPVNAGNSALILNGTGNYSFNGYMRNQSSGILGLIMNGSGTQILSGGNISYTGPTTINAGLLRVTTGNTSSFSSPVTVNSGGTLAQNGPNTGFAAAATINLNGGMLLSDESGGYITDEGALTLAPIRRSKWRVPVRRAITACCTSTPGSIPRGCKR